uniref:Putative plant transposon protein domain-containing protein n=1 Tax=Cajanus cajan TaxID=3821 RepID=A0A151U9Y7_CAJCA|nr:hypothetical protein KK1_020360 [Cajanus cajan]
MASGSRKRSSKETKGKNLATSDRAAGPKLPQIEQVLNQTRFFSQRDQMIKYGKEFYHRTVLHPKVMDFIYFATSGLYFLHHIEYQGLQHFVALKCDFFEDLIKVFYSNLRVSEAGFLYSDVNKTKIKIKPSDWLTLAEILEELQFDRDIALTSMIRSELQGRNVRNVGSLNINDRLLHYVYVHILAPRSSNFSQLLQEDIFVLWALKNNILINWPHYIMQHMVKCKDNGMPLPYPILISRILVVFDVDLSIDVAVELGWAHFFNKKTLKKLNVVNVNGVWLHGRDNHDHGQNVEDEDHAMLEDHVDEQPVDIT